MASTPATDYFSDSEEELYKNELSDLSSISINYNQGHGQSFWMRRNLMTRIFERIEICSWYLEAYKVIQIWIRWRIMILCRFKTLVIRYLNALNFGDQVTSSLDALNFSDQFFGRVKF
ncbi:hypothetical protein RclHR1_00510032 [Rhizophagus clarus]|uniref:Uncharacterized protein n=1 Tax=Rhizophagus clarus TaxID=94130 RepID=A0A2Z6RMI0_9GLOM|nr:hypothetical protein RclHR1_00510032 [Rhizophagus clarus]